MTAADFQPTQPSVWIWEGVVMYLTDAAVTRTLREVAALSAKGSKLLVQYHEPADERSTLKWNRWFTRSIGEPQIGLRTRTQMAEAVEDAGFGVIRDIQVDERHRICRLLVAVR
jgi:O-methyltransferase involved in polyketide biosynthesis